MRETEGEGRRDTGVDPEGVHWVPVNTPFVLNKKKIC